MAEVDPEHRDAGRADQIHGAQHGAVAAQADGQVDAVELGHQLGAPAGRIVEQDAHVVAGSPQPGRVRSASSMASGRWVWATNPMTAISRRRSGPGAGGRKASVDQCLDVERDDPVRSLTWRWTRNSTLPSAPRNGDTMTPIMAAARSR